VNCRVGGSACPTSILTTPSLLAGRWEMTLASNTLDYNTSYDFIIISKSKSGKTGVKNINVQVLEQSALAPLDSKI